MSKQASEKRIPLFRTIALANAFAVAASKGKKAKIIAAIQHAVKYDKELKTEVVSRIAYDMGVSVRTIKKLRVSDLKSSNGLQGRLNDVFEKLASEMENVLQGVGESNKVHDQKGSDNRHRLQVVAPQRSQLWHIRRRVA